MGSVMSWVVISVRVVLVLGVAALISRIVFRREAVTRPSAPSRAGTGFQAWPALTLVPPVNDQAGSAGPTTGTPAGGHDLGATASTTTEPGPGSEQGPALAAAPSSPAQAIPHGGENEEFTAEVGAPMPPAAPDPSPKLAPVKRSDLAAIRVWAREHGYVVADRGRIAAAVITAYDESR